jgi:hypothetical protein
MPTVQLQRRESSTVRADPRAPEIVDRLGAPLFMETAPGNVRATCRGFVGTGADRDSALRDLADQIEDSGTSPT